MATYFSAKDIVETSLQKIGRFPTTQDQADAVDLKRGLSTLESILQELAGTQSVTCNWETIEIPLLAGVSAYPLANIVGKEGVNFIYSAELLNVAAGSRCEVKIINEDEFNGLDSLCTGEPCKIFMDRGNHPVVHAYPMLGAPVPPVTFSLLLKVQHYFSSFDKKGEADINHIEFALRPSWYRWAWTKLSYELGNGIIRRLPEGELTRLKADYEESEQKLSAFDNAQTGNQPFTLPWGQ